jgi:protein arginine kinase
MKLNHLLNVQSPWLKIAEEDSGIILSSWLNLSRNLKATPFLSQINAADKLVLKNFISEKIENNLKNYKFDKIKLDEIDPIDLGLLKERRLIERTTPAYIESAELLHTTTESKSILINGNDHIKIQIAHHGLSGSLLWPQISHLDDELMHIFQYAYTDQFGFLTSSLNQVGTSLKVEILLHLPAFVFTGRINQKIHQLLGEGVFIRHFFEDTDIPIGNLFLISNQKTIGSSELEIIEKLESFAIQLSLEEKTLRETLFTSNQQEFLDKIHRAYGLLANSYHMSFQETFTYLSILKIGIDLKVLEFITPQNWCKLFMNCLPAHIQEIEGEALTKEKIDQVRSSILSKKLKALEHKIN